MPEPYTTTATAMRRMSAYAGENFTWSGGTYRGVFRAIDTLAELREAGIDDIIDTRLVCHRSQFKALPAVRDEIDRDGTVFSIREVKADPVNFHFLLRTIS